MKEFIIIEDEPIAARRLKNLILQIDEEYHFVVHLESVEDAVNWFKTNTFQGLICMDIHLADGTCFDILNQIDIQSPVIFTTAYEDYMVRSFEILAIAYLLKPLKKEELEKALLKYEKLEPQLWGNQYKELQENVIKQAPVFLKRLLIKIGNGIKVISIAEVSYFFTQNKSVYAALLSGKNYPIDYNLDEIESLLAPNQFFRVNRQFMVSVNAVLQMFVYTKSRLKLMLQPAIEAEVIVSYEKVAAFKKWLMEN